MKSILSLNHSGRRGYALIVTLIFLGVTLIVFAGVMAYVATNAKITTRNNLFNEEEAAAESATEYALSSMIRDFDNQNLNAASAYASLIPSQVGWPIQFQFNATNGSPNQTSISMGVNNWTQLPSPYDGLYGMGQNCSIASSAVALNQDVVPAASIAQSIWFGTIPVFQYAIFYNMDLEINPGNSMTINGRVHSNGNIWATGNSASSPLTFSSNVEAVGKVTQTRGPNDPTDTRTGNVIYTLTANNPLNNANSLTLPIGTNNNPASTESILNLPPSGMGAPNSSAYSAQGQNYTYNEADLIVSNAASGGTNITVFYQDKANAVILARLSPDTTNIVKVGSGKSAVNVTNVFFSFVTNATFYDFREYSYVQAVQIDVGKLGLWLVNTTLTGGWQYNVQCGGTDGQHGHKGHWINGVYVYNSIPQIGGSPSTAGQLSAVRVMDGQQLPIEGFTVATPQPLYVEGNYNVTTNGGVTSALTLGSATNNTVPAALMGDSITILSANWNDANNIKGNALGTRKSADTTVNAAALEGIVPSVTDGGGNKHYSGGVENFLRLLEDWSQNSNSHNGAGVLTYNGSIVVMFPSLYATNLWQDTGNYYNAPNRQWGFDVDLTNPNRLPPMTPQVRAVVRQGSGWAAW